MTTPTTGTYSIILVALAVKGPVDEALAQVDAILDAGSIQDDLGLYAGCEVLASAVEEAALDRVSFTSVLLVKDVRKAADEAEHREAMTQSVIAAGR